MNYKLETVPCAVCGSDNYSVHIKEARDLYNDTQNFFDVVKCDSCGFVFTNPRPTKETIGVFYPDSAGYYTPGNPFADKDSRKEKVIRTMLAHYYGYEFESPHNRFTAFLLKLLLMRKIALARIPKFVPSGRLLDVGCSWGMHLAKMASYGWDVYGLEFNAKAAEYARDVLGLNNVSIGSFETCDYQNGFFDVVHMGMVLEHLHDPAASLKMANKVMKPAGQLIVSVPDITGLEAKLYKKISYTLHVPQHLNHFSPKTITMVLEKAGFKVEKIIHQNFDRDLVASADYLRNKTLTGVLHNKLVRKTFVRCFVSLLAAFGKTSRMTVYARKQND
ncbi:MAG: methyltransferase domain-containing protein [Anaerohalosphaeraceae bacterium]|nr:methyltransferase domain-containing protein [Anaerohalosphaeraceae bacterium]